MKTLLLLNNAYWPSIGGVENSLRHLAQVAHDRGCNVKIVVGDIGLARTNAFCALEVLDGIPIYRYRIKPLPLVGPLNLLLSTVLQRRLLINLRKKYPNALVISRFHLSTLVARYVGFQDVRYLVPGSAAIEYTAGMTRLRVWRSPTIWLKCLLHTLLQRQALRKSAVYVFSNRMEEQCVALAPDLTTSIRRTKPGVDPERFAFNANLDVKVKRRYLGLPPTRKLVLFVGRFVPAKGVDVLIRALTHLSTDTDLVLVGEGESEGDYRRQIVALGLEDRVYIRGATRDVESYYESCNVFAMSSNQETFGQTILEAMASGLPLVAFSTQAGVMTATEELGLDEFINYADRYCPLELADGIKTQMLVSVRQRQLQSERVLQQYSWQTLFDDLIE